MGGGGAGTPAPGPVTWPERGPPPPPPRLRESGPRTCPPGWRALPWALARGAARGGAGRSRAHCAARAPQPGSEPWWAGGRRLELRQTLLGTLGVGRLPSKEAGPGSHSLWPSGCPAPTVVSTPLCGPAPHLLSVLTSCQVPGSQPEPGAQSGPAGPGSVTNTPARPCVGASDEKGFVSVFSSGSLVVSVGWGRGDVTLTDPHRALRLLVPPRGTKARGRSELGALREVPGLSPARPRASPGAPAVPGPPHLDPGSRPPPSTGTPAPRNLCLGLGDPHHRAQGSSCPGSSGQGRAGP